MKQGELQHRVDLGNLTTTRRPYLKAMFISQLFIAQPAFAHGGEDHSRPKAEKQPSDAAESTLEPDSASLENSAAPIPDPEQLQPLDGEGQTQEISTPPVLLPNSADRFSLGAVGIGEVLFMLIIAGPLLLKTLRHRLHA